MKEMYLLLRPPSRAAIGRTWMAQGHGEHHGTFSTAALSLTPLPNMFTLETTAEIIPTAGCQTVRGANCQTIEL